MSSSLSDIKQLQSIEAAVHVETRGAVTTLRIIAKGENSMFYVRMPNAVWREFCKRQLAVPPPLPKSGGNYHE